MVDNEDTDANVSPSQIPLLEDVFNASLPNPAPPKRRRAEDHNETVTTAAQTADLFADPAATASKASQSDIYSATLDPKTVDPETLDPETLDEETVEAVKGKLRQKTESIIDSLVEEYSVEILRRLRNELTSVLDDLENLDPKKP